MLTVILKNILGNRFWKILGDQLIILKPGKEK